MINTKILKTSRVIAVILLIVIFSIAGIVACKGNEATNPTESGLTLIPGDTGPVIPVTNIGINTNNPGTNTGTDTNTTGDTNIDNPGDTNIDPPAPSEPPKPTFAADTYYKIYAPWVKWDESQAPNGWRTNVSWQDTNTLSQIWKQQIEGGKYNDGKRWFIRDAANRQNDHRAGNNAHYYYFDKDFNIVYYRQGKGSLTVRKFITGIIVKYNKGRNAGTWAIGGLYETILDKNEITDNGYDSLNIFMGASHMGERGKGCLAVLTMNTSYDDIYQNEFGVDHYYATKGGEEAWYNVEQYTSKNPEELDSFLNEKGNLSWRTEIYNFRFVFNKPYEWHLTDHLNQQGWH